MPAECLGGEGCAKTVSVEIIDAHLSALVEPDVRHISRPLLVRGFWNIGWNVVEELLGIHPRKVWPVRAHA